MRAECGFCGLALEADDPLCPRCGHLVEPQEEERTGISADATVTYRATEPIRRIETSIKPKEGFLSKIASGIKAIHRSRIPEPGRKNRSIPKRLRFSVLERDEFCCRYCGRSGRETVLELDHAISWSAGGETTLDNLVTSCRDCNRGKWSDSVSPKTREPIDPGKRS